MDEDKSAVLLTRQSPRSPPDPHMSAEFRGLAKAAGYRVLAEITQCRDRDYRYQIGRGKIEEALSYNPSKLIFYNALSPGQVFNIRSEFSANLIDRFNLILEIFSSRARTREAKFQVELARLSYEAPQVKNALSLRKRGEQPGFRGSGAYEQSMYHDIRGRMAKIRTELDDVQSMGEERRQRRREQGFDLVALAGYTNAGKSTLHRALTGSDVPAKDQPFTTLTPTTRALEVLGRRVLLTDTVGFIDDLPHFLIRAFRSTLSEISEADLVLLVADISDPVELLQRKLIASHKALWDCGAMAPIVTVLNKADRLDEAEAEQRARKIADLAPYPVIASASSGMGLGVLEECISQRLMPLREYEIALPYTPEGYSELSRLYETSELLAVSYEEEMRVRMRARGEVAARSGLAFCQKRLMNSIDEPIDESDHGKGGVD